jgi:hypothetical protein
MRALARAAGVDHSILARARDGERPLTVALVRAVARALRVWSEKCDELAASLEAEADRTEREEEG